MNGEWVRIPPGTWIFVCCECRVLSGRGLCDELIARPEESYRLWCVVVCDLETSRIGAPYIYIYIYIYDISSLRVKHCFISTHAQTFCSTIHAQLLSVQQQKKPRNRRALAQVLHNACARTVVVSIEVLNDRQVSNFYLPAVSFLP